MGIIDDSNDSFTVFVTNFFGEEVRKPVTIEAGTILSEIVDTFVPGSKEALCLVNGKEQGPDFELTPNAEITLAMKSQKGNNPLS